MKSKDHSIAIPEKKISMAEIAVMADVSIATVSRVLNKNGRYSAETEQKVMKIVEKYGYQINQSAKSLRTSKTNSIGVIVPDITNEFFANIVRAIEKYAVPEGYTVFVCDSDENSHMEDLHISSLVSRDVDGIIYISVKEDVKKIYEDYKIPVVYIDRRSENAGTLVISDNESGGFLATEELIMKGCRNIVALKDKQNFSTVRHRFSGYLKALNKYSIPVKDQFIIKTNVTYYDSKNAMLDFINKGYEFDGIFANNDIMAIGALHALRENNIKVPDDVKIVGFDGTSLSEICDPPITTIIQDFDKIGQRSVELLFDLIDDVKLSTVDYIIPVKIACRKSTSCN
jgi:transcriptional regulator, lacI family